jgi:hypothetical protein
MYSCGNKQSNESAAEATEVVAEPSADDIQSAQEKACNELKSWGAEDAYFDDNYLCYVVAPEALSATADEVAEQLFPMFEDVPNIKGIKVISSTDNTELGSYSK